MATVTAERTTIEKPRIEETPENTSIPLDAWSSCNATTPLAAEKMPEGEIAKGFWDKVGIFFGKWSEKHGEHMMKTGYWYLFRM